MVDSVVAGSEISVLNVADIVLREERIAIPEPIGDVDAAAEPLLLRAGAIERRAADDGPVEVHPEHQVGREARRHTREIVAAVGADEVYDHVAPRPVALRELIVVVRHGRGPRVLEPRLEPAL